MSIVLETKEEIYEFPLVEDENPAKLSFRKIHSDKMMEIYEEHGEYVQGEGTAADFKVKSNIKAMKEMLNYCVVGWEGVVDEEGEPIPKSKITGTNLYRLLVQTEKLDAFIDKVTPEDKGDEIKN